MPSCCVGESLCARKGFDPTKQHKCMNCEGYAHGVFCCFEWMSREDHGINITDNDAKKVKEEGGKLPSAMINHINSNPSKSDICMKCAVMVKGLLSAPVSTPAASVDDDDDEDENHRRRAILEVLNMTRLIPTVFADAKELAMKVGWSKEHIDKFLKHNKDWAPTIELAHNHSPDGIEDLEEEPNSQTYYHSKNRLRTDVVRFIKATRAGEVSICSWYDHDKEHVIITRLPRFKCPDIDFYRCGFLHELMPGEYITLFHNSIVNYHQHASYASKEDWCYGFNAHPSPYNFDFVGSEIYFTVKPLFEAVYTGVKFTNEPSLDHRDRVPTAEELTERIGEERFADLAAFCRTNNICNLKKYLRENQGKHALMPGLWLSLEALIVSRHLFQVFDEMLQDWERRKNSNADGQDEEEKSEEEEAGLLAELPEPTSSKMKKKVVYEDNYGRILQSSQDKEDFVNRMREFLDGDEGIMEMKRGNLEGALGLWETRGHVYATLNLISAVEFFLIKPDRFKAYEKGDVFEVNVLKKKCMDDAGAEPLTWERVNRKVRMKFAALIDHNIMIKPGNCRCPLTGMTAVVYSKEHKKEVHRIILDCDIF